MPGVFLCFLAGLVPPIWNRYILQPKLRHWDTHFANPAERELAREANRRVGWPDWLAGEAA
jgi:alkane 1-monooxygenase